MVKNVHPDGKTDRYGDFIPKQRFSSKVKDGRDIKTGESLIIKVLQVTSTQPGDCVNFLYQIIASPTDPVFKDGIKVELCKKKDDKSLYNEMREHIGHIYVRNSAQYEFKGSFRVIV